MLDNPDFNFYTKFLLSLKTKQTNKLDRSFGEGPRKSQHRKGLVARSV